MPTQPCVMRPRLSTSVISTNTSPAPEFASMPRCVMCQSPITPSAAEYWHIGATLMRLVSSRPLILNGVNRALMGLSGMDGDEGEMRVSNGGPERSSQPRYGQRQRLRARHQRVDHQILIRRVRLAADRPDRAHGRGAARGGEAVTRAAAAELAFDLEADVARATRIVLEQTLRIWRLDQRLELACDCKCRAGARHSGGLDDLPDFCDRVLAIGRREVAQVDLALRPGRHGVDSLAA